MVGEGPEAVVDKGRAPAVRKTFDEVVGRKGLVGG